MTGETPIPTPTDPKEHAAGVSSDAQVPSDGTSGPARRAGIGGQLSRFTGLAIWALLIVIFALWIPHLFLEGSTAKSIASGQAITAVLAIGVLFPLAASVYDLSIAQNLGLSAVVVSSLMVHSHVSPVLAVIITLLMGLSIGLLNGFFVAIVGVNSFIATLGMSSVLLALTELISNNLFIGPVSSGFQAVTAHRPLGIPIVLIYALIIGVVAWYALEHTPMGRRIYATGANPDAARLAGVRTNRYVIGTLAVAGLVSSLAGILATSQIGEVSSTLGPPYLLPAFAACFLGTTQVKIGRFNVWGTLIALFLLATGVTGLQLAGAQIWVTDLFNGVALIGAVSVAVYTQKRRGAKIKSTTARRADAASKNAASTG
jgi:ribose transport system permease protein